MRKHFLKFFCALVLAFTLAICATACDSKDDNNSQANKSSFATTYSTLSEKNNATSKWREGMVSGNGDGERPCDQGGRIRNKRFRI